MLILETLVLIPSIINIIEQERDASAS